MNAQGEARYHADDVQPNKDTTNPDPSPKQCIHSQKQDIGERGALKERTQIEMESIAV